MEHKIVTPSPRPSGVSGTQAPKQWIRTLMDFLTQSSLWVVGCLSALYAWIGLATHGRVDRIGMGALALFIFAVYTLDRYRAPLEDRREAAVDLDPTAFVARHRPVFRGALLLALAGMATLCLFHPRLAGSFLAAIGITAFYVIPIPGLRRRLKDIPYFKNFYAPLSLMLFPVVFLDCWPRSAVGALLLLYVGLICQVNAWTFDLKDIEGDRRAGIRLLSTTLPPRTLLAWLGVESLVLAALSAWLLPFPWNLGAALTALLYALSLGRLRRHFSLRWLFLVHDGLLAVPLLTALTTGMKAC